MPYHKPALPISLFSNIKQMNVVWMDIDSFFKSGTPVPPPMEGRKIPIPRNFHLMISRYEWFLTYFCQQAKKVEQVIFCPMNVPQHPFLSHSFKPVMYRSSKTGHKQVIFSFGSVNLWYLQELVYLAELRGFPTFIDSEQIQNTLKSLCWIKVCQLRK